MSTGAIAVGPKGVTRALTMKECVAVMERMFREAAEEIRAQPGKVIHQVDRESVILTMPSYSARLRRFAVKLVTEFKRNPKLFGLPAQGGNTLLMSGTSAEVLAMIDSAALTAVRTGAVSGLATRLLSRKDSKVVGIIGSGQQARTQLEAVCTVRAIDEAKVYSLHPTHTKRFSSEMARTLGIRTTPCRDFHRVLEDADIVIVATNSATPVLEWDDVPPGCHINSIGVLPHRTELAPKIISMSSVFVDTVDGVLREAGDVIQAVKSGLFSRDRIVADLVGLCSQRSLGRTGDQEVTLFKSVGFGLQDLYAASYLYDKVAANPKRFYPDVWKVKLPGGR